MIPASEFQIQIIGLGHWRQVSHLLVRVSGWDGGSREAGGLLRGVSRRLRAVGGGRGRFAQGFGSQPGVAGHPALRLLMRLQAGLYPGQPCTRECNSVPTVVSAIEALGRTA